jgi:hypothetical protein
LILSFEPDKKEVPEDRFVMKKTANLNAPYQPASFSFRDKAKVAEILSRYPVWKAAFGHDAFVRPCAASSC